MNTSFKDELYQKELFMKNISKSTLFAGILLSFAMSATSFAQESAPAQSDLAIHSNSLLGNTVKKHEESPELDAKTLVFIDKKESTIEALKQLKASEVKNVKVLQNDSVKKKYREKGITETISVQTK